MAATSWAVLPGLVLAAAGALSGLLVPAIIAAVPEPAPAPDEDEQDAAEGAGQVEEPKELYAAIADRPGLRARCVVAGGVVGGLVGARVGWEVELAYLGALIPVGLSLAVIDWRTRLLPRLLVYPAYLAVAALVLVAFALTGATDDLVRAGWGLLVAFALFWLLHVLPQVWPFRLFLPRNGMGYGDVRLSGVLGLALGYLGWGALLTGIYAGFLVGGLAGVLLSVLRVVDRRAYPFGPFMLLGAVAGVVLGPYVAAWYA